MAEEARGSIPPYTTYASFKNLLADLRDEGMPSHVTRSVMKGSNSAKATMTSSLKSMGLIDDEMTPSPLFVSLVESSDDEYPARLHALLRRTYSFLLDDSVDLANTTTEIVAKKFQEAGAGGSTVSKGMAFFLAAAREAGLEVSPRVKPPVSPKNSARKRARPSLPAGRGQGDENKNGGGQNADANILPGEGMERITVPLRGLADGVIYFPQQLEKDDARRAVKAAIFILKSYYGLDEEG